MVTTHNFENYRQEEADNGDLVLKDSNDNEVMRWDVDANGGDGEWVFPAVSTEGAGIGRDGLTRDYSDEWPSRVRQPEFDAALLFEPHRGVSNPVLSAADVDDVSNPTFVADPFVVAENGLLHMFFELWRDGSPSDTWIGHATSVDGLEWTYDQTVRGVRTSDNGALNYPYTFKHEGSWYQLDHTDGTDLNLYVADPFPTGWTKAADLIEAGSSILQDPTPVYWEGAWYMFTHGADPDEKYCYYADDITSEDWTAHPSNPVVTGAPTGRNGGRAIVRDDYIDLACRGAPGSENEGVAFLRITELTKTSFSATAHSNGLVFSDSGQAGAWEQRGMHHCDLLMPHHGGQPLAIVDGKDTDAHFSIGVYTQANDFPTEVRAETSDSTLPAGTANPYNVQRYDYGDNWDQTNNVYVVQSNGLYEVHAQATLKSLGSTSFRFTAILQEDGSTVASDNTNVNTTGTNNDTRVTASVDTHVYLTEGAQLEAKFFNASGEDQTLSASDTLTYFYARRIR